MICPDTANTSKVQSLEFSQSINGSHALNRLAVRRRRRMSQCGRRSAAGWRPALSVAGEVGVDAPANYLLHIRWEMSPDCT